MVGTGEYCWKLQALGWVLIFPYFNSSLSYDPSVLPTILLTRCIGHFDGKTHNNHFAMVSFGTFVGIYQPQHLHSPSIEEHQSNPPLPKRRNKKFNTDFGYCHLLFQPPLTKF